MSAGHFRVTAVPLAALLALASLHPLPASAQSSMPQPFDGTYSGTAQRIAGDDTTCSTGAPVTVVVQDGQFRQSWRPSQDFSVRIGADGRFYARTGALAVQAEKHMTLSPVIQGQVTGRTLVADYGTRWCRYRLEATRS
jgi:hypothetical protein